MKPYELTAEEIHVMGKLFFQIILEGSHEKIDGNDEFTWKLLNREYVIEEHSEYVQENGGRIFMNKWVMRKEREWSFRMEGNFRKKKKYTFHRIWGQPSVAIVFHPQNDTHLEIFRNDLALIKLAL